MERENTVVGVGDKFDLPDGPAEDAYPRESKDGNRMPLVQWPRRHLSVLSRVSVQGCSRALSKVYLRVVGRVLFPIDCLPHGDK